MTPTEVYITLAVFFGIPIIGGFFLIKHMLSKFRPINIKDKEDEEIK